jgi:hypothetical protein
MKIIALLILLSSGFLLLGGCHSNPSSRPARHTSGDSPTAPVHPPPEKRDSTPAAPKENYDTLDQVTRSHFCDVQAFLDFVKRPNSDFGVDGEQWLKTFRIGNVDSLLNFITADSLEIDDASADPGKDSLKYSQAMLREQLTRRKGDAFEWIGIISLHITIPYPQYSHTTFSTDKTDSVPNLNVAFSQMILYFRAEKGSVAYKLYRIESDHIADL